MDWARRIELATVVVAAVVAVGGLWYSNVQTRQANEQAREDRALAREGQITDRYTAAVGNLGEDKMDVRLGGIYALQRIMQDSRRDQPTIANVLATYIRTHTAKPPAKGRDVPADVHAALTVLATRDSSRDGNGFFLLDLRGVKLPNVALPSVPKSSVALHRIDLSDADLNGAFLRNTDLKEARLIRANLRGADLEGADLHEANLEGADLRGADLGGADLTGTIMTGADLRKSDLRGSKISKHQIDSALTDSSTRVR
ncbi:pentapeptide repeat-containing protein [Streptomyces sp. NPDC058011]|uniref:pentapeptide repeat-containing protein n=1 Tax=Streptomyces sp. NPDC058011 TaxID=3346305 RepID=UPI0036EDD230